jgi:hypothetical protein
MWQTIENDKIVIFGLPYLCNRKHRGNQQQDIFQVTRETAIQKAGSPLPRVERVAVRLNVLHSRFLVALI